MIICSNKITICYKSFKDVTEHSIVIIDFAC